MKSMQDGKVDIEYSEVHDQLDRVTIFRRKLGAPVFALNRTAQYERAYERRHEDWESSGENFFIIPRKHGEDWSVLGK